MKIQIQTYILITMVISLSLSCSSGNVNAPKYDVAQLDIATARERMIQADQKIVLLGIDGLTWHKLDAYRQRGMLPNFDKIIKKGASGKLESINPMFSISLWTTIATGVDFETHGVQYFYKIGKNGSMLPYTSIDRKVKALWNIMDDLDEQSGWVSWWGSWPAEPVKGFNISNYFIADFGFRDVEELSLFYPPDISEELRGLKTTYTAEWGETKADRVIGDLRRINKGNLGKDYWGDFKYGSLNWVYENKRNDFLYNFLRNAYRNDALAVNSGLQMMNEFDTRLTGIYCNGIDGVSHKFWKYDKIDNAAPKEATVTSEESLMFGKVLSEYYSYHDELLGQVLDAIDDKTTLVIVSDHGFQYVPKSNYISLNPLLNKLGFISFKDDDKIDLATSLVHEITVKPWDKKRFIRINKRSNDFKDLDGTPLGTVKAGKEEAEVRQKLIDDLKILKLKESGMPLFKEVRKPTAKEINENDGQGDIVALLNRALFESNFNDEILLADGSSISLDMIAIRNYHSGNHDQFDSVIIMVGPLAKEGYEIKNARMYDIAPTILAMLGLPVADYMLDNGKVLTDPLKEEFNENFPVQVVETYGEFTNAFFGLDVSTSSADEEIRRTLQGLGYMQ